MSDIVSQCINCGAVTVNSPAGAVVCPKCGSTELHQFPAAALDESAPLILKQTEVSGERRIELLDARSIPAPDPYLCPECGADDWKACYRADVVQRVDTLVKLPDGSFEASYSEAATIVEEGPTEEYRCRECDYVLAVEHGQ